MHLDEAVEGKGIHLIHLCMRATCFSPFRRRRSRRGLRNGLHAAKAQRLSKHATDIPLLMACWLAH